MYVYVENKGAYKEFDIVWRQISKRNLEHKYPLHVGETDIYIYFLVLGEVY